MGKNGASKSNRQVVVSLYVSLARGDAAAVTAMLAADLDWWFHGPRRCQHMRRLLTGEATGSAAFRFTPARVAEVGGAGNDGWVVAEGWGGEHDYWVHAWCLRAGVITSFREYFNTSVTVREAGVLRWTWSGPCGRANHPGPGAAPCQAWCSPFDKEK